MTKKEIEKIVEDINFSIECNLNNTTFRKCEYFYNRIGMSKRRNLEVLTELDKAFKKKKIAVINKFKSSNGKMYETRSTLSEFKKGEIIYFRRIETVNKNDSTVIKNQKMETVNKPQKT